jgi:photosystem II stability/assembly factor-like uncharacterized protein
MVMQFKQHYAFITIILIIIVSFCDTSAQDTGDWEILNEWIYTRGAIDFVNGETGWTVGGNTLWKTDDSGETWNGFPIPGGDHTDFTSASTGWTIGSSEVFRTEDGGLTWFLSTTSQEHHYVLHLDAVNDSVIFITGVITATDSCAGWIFKTTDGGTSWHDISPSHPLNHIDFNRINFFNSNQGIVAGRCHGKAEILKTVDGGDNWEYVSLDPLVDLEGLQFINDSTAFFWARDEEGRALFCITTDLFESWTIRYVNQFSIKSCHVLDENTIFAVMLDTLLNNCLMKSSDGGYTWDNKQSVWGQASGIYFVNHDTGFTVGEGFYKSVDWGETWILNRFWAPFRDVYFINQNTGFAGSGRKLRVHGGGTTGDMFVTNNGGNSWDPVCRTGFTGSILFVNDLIGYFIEEGAINKTNDQGQTWNTVYRNNGDSTGYDMWLEDICFFDENNGWVVGNVSLIDSTGAGMLGTTDGGEHWDLVWTYLPADRFGSIHAVNNTCWAVGDPGIIAKYTEQTGWQKMPTVTDLPLNDVFFYNDSHGWISCGYFDWGNSQSLLLRTQNGGETWQQIRYSDYLINDMFFEDSAHGWAVGCDTSRQGMVLETFDGGNNWTIRAEGLSERLNALHFKDEVGWAVGGNGLVLRTDNWTTWINQNTREAYPSKFRLSQNNPNPFNPSTKIKFSLPQTYNVRIDIYNTLGQNIKTILNEKRQAGDHEFEFNAQNLASGVYYYRIEAGDFQDVKKMVLLK